VKPHRSCLAVASEQCRNARHDGSLGQVEMGDYLADLAITDRLSVFADDGIEGDRRIKVIACACIQRSVERHRFGGVTDVRSGFIA